MNSYFFTGWVTRWHQGRFIDGCVSLIVYGADAEAAEKNFEQWLLSANGEGSPVPVKVEKIVGAPVLDQLFTETGYLPIDWKQIGEEMCKTLEAAEGDDMAQGYWVDCNQWPQPHQISATIESLQAELPEDIRSGLNWSPEHTFFFLISVLSPPPAQPQFPEEDLDETHSTAHGGAAQEDQDEQQGLESVEEPAPSPFPEIVDKELAVLVRARNSVVAAWLWKKYSASTPLAGHAIR